MRRSSHIIIIGPGRCGTSAFVRLLHNLKYETGFTDEFVNRDWGRSGSGLEWPIRGKKAKYPQPYVIKCPTLSEDLENRIEKWNWEIDHAYILVRNIHDIAKSRLKRTRGEDAVLPDEDLEEVRNKSYMRAGKALLNCVTLNIPYSIIEYPRWANDPEYCYNSLHEKPSWDIFLSAHKGNIKKGRQNL